MGIMQIEQTYPPNIAQLRQFFPIDDHAPIFTYGDTIHAPNHEKLPQDIIEHEKAHIAQQKQFTTPDIWWNKYILDTEFRKSQETEAYAVQYQWIKKQYGTKIANESLLELAGNLSGTLYKLGMTYNEAEVAIKRYGKILI